MAREETSWRRFGARWARVTEAALSPLDIEKGADRLLRSRVVGPRRRGDFPWWIAAACLTGTAAILLFVQTTRRPISSVDHRSPAAGVRVSASTAEQGVGHAGQTATWQELERAGQFERAVEEAERAGLDTIYDSVNADDLMSLARAARFAGREDVSKGALLTCRRRFPASRDAAMAAYLLARNAPPAEAVKCFSTYLAEQPNGLWAREASGRLIEAYRASGNTAAARDAAQQYLVRFPTGPHADFAKMVLDHDG
jgi:tetratricopeptide (TPR) repeat protein